MKELDYGKEYKYAHDYDGHFVKQDYMPKEIQGKRLWEAQPNAAEARLDESMKRLWGEKK
jgi:putative ATPase